MPTPFSSGFKGFAEVGIPALLLAGIALVGVRSAAPDGAGISPTSDLSVVALADPNDGTSASVNPSSNTGVPGSSNVDGRPESLLATETPTVGLTGGDISTAVATATNDSSNGVVRSTTSGTTSQRGRVTSADRQVVSPGDAAVAEEQRLLDDYWQAVVRQDGIGFTDLSLFDLPILFLPDLDLSAKPVVPDTDASDDDVVVDDDDDRVIPVAADKSPAPEVALPKAAPPVKPDPPASTPAPEPEPVVAQPAAEEPAPKPEPDNEGTEDPEADDNGDPDPDPDPTIDESQESTDESVTEALEPATEPDGAATPDSDPQLDVPLSTEASRELQPLVEPVYPTEPDAVCPAADKVATAEDIVPDEGVDLEPSPGESTDPLSNENEPVIDLENSDGAESSTGCGLERSDGESDEEGPVDEVPVDHAAGSGDP